MAIARSVAIVGGGIGGLTAANALKRIGLSVSLYERSPYFIPTAGAGFGFQPNGQIALNYIGLRDQAEHLVHPFHKWQLIDDHGRVLNSSNRLSEYGPRFGFYLGGAARAELVDILKQPLENADLIHYSHNLIDLQQDTDGVTLKFENPDQKLARVDMVIGADGIHSTVVRRIFSPTALPVYSNENIFYGVIERIDEQTTINPLVTAKHTLTQYFGRGEFVTYRISNKGEMIWAATYPSKEPPTKGNDNEWTTMNNQRELTRLLTRFPQSHPVHQCAAVTDPQRLLHFGLYYRQHRADGWHRQRIGLLGDACHAILPYIGQGANLAIEDAVLLAVVLEKNHFHIESSFDEYFKKRYKRTKLAADVARYLGRFSHSENRFIHAIRQSLMPRLMSSNLMLRIAEKELYENCPIPIENKKNKI